MKTMAERDKRESNGESGAQRATGWVGEKIEAVREFYTETRHEMQRVTWPTRSRVQAFGVEDKFGRIEIPTETVAERRGGKTIETQRLFYPGYVLVEMDADAQTGKIADDLWHLVKSTPRVTGFVGTGQFPTPL